MAEEKQSFVLYKSWNGAVELMSDESAGRLFKAIMCYAAKGTVPQIGADIVPLFGMMRSQFDIDNDKYAAKCAKLSNNGKKGAEVKKQKQAIVSNCKQTEANTSLYDMRCNDMSCNDYDNSVCDTHTHAREGKQFVKPTVAEINAYCAAKGFYIDAQAFIDHYDSCGWVIGKNKPMKDWRAAVNKWHRKDVEDGKEYKPPSVEKVEDTRTPEEKTIEDIPPAVRHLYSSYAEYDAIKNQ